MRLYLFAAILLLAFPGSAVADSVSKTDFTAHLQQALTGALPTAKIETLGELSVKATFPGESAVTFDLTNAYALYQTTPLDEKRFINHYVATLAGISKEKVGVDRAQIRPVLKARTWLKEKLPITGQIGSTLQPLYDDLNDDLVIVYVLDDADKVAFLSLAQLGQLGLKKEELKEIALTNLRKSARKPTSIDAGGVSLVTIDGFYDASVLLLTDFWRQQAAALGGDPVAIVPARNSVMFTSAKNVEGVARLRIEARALAAKSAYSISDKLFVFRDGGFETFTE